MTFKNIFKLFLITIIVIGLLNFVYADSGPTIGANQAQITAKNYLSSHNLSYTAVTPSDNNWQIKVKDNKTGEVKWIPFLEYKTDLYENGGSENRYISIENVPTLWNVQVNNNGEKIGQIDINGETGEILKVVINGDILENNIPQGNQTNEDPSTSLNTTNQVPQDTSNNTAGIILAVVSVLIIAGAVYWFKIRK